MMEDIKFQEKVSFNRFLLFIPDFRTVMNNYKELIKYVEDSEGNENPKAIFLYEQLSMIQEKSFNIKRAAESMETARTRWEKCYGTKDNDHRQFVLSRLSFYYSRLLELPDDGPILRPQKAASYLVELCRMQEKIYGSNSVHTLICNLNLFEMEIQQKHLRKGIDHFVTALDIHDVIFEEALYQIGK